MNKFNLVNQLTLEDGKSGDAVLDTRDFMDPYGDCYLKFLLRFLYESCRGPLEVKHIQISEETKKNKWVKTRYFGDDYTGRFGVRTRSFG